jgi:hypothetical protein
MKNAVFWDVTPCGHIVTSLKTAFVDYCDMVMQEE